MAYNESLGFGSGVMFMTNAAGGTPVRVGVLQDVSFDISFEEKPLYGTSQWPVALARGKAKGAVKAKFARIDGATIGSLFFGATPAAGEEIIADLEAGVVPGAPAYTITVIHSSNWKEDKGVFYATTGQPLVKVNSGPTSGQYSVASGIYTFSAADASAAVLISYAWNDGTTGYKTTITNQPMGTVSYFQTDLYQINPEVSGSQWGMRLYRCASSKLALNSKNDDWMIPEFDASVQANAAGKVLDFNTPQ